MNETTLISKHGEGVVVYCRRCLVRLSGHLSLRKYEEDKKLAEVVVASSKLTMEGLFLRGSILESRLQVSSLNHGFSYLTQGDRPPFFIVFGKRLIDRIAIAHESWVAYMDRPSAGLTGAVGPPRRK